MTEASEQNSKANADSSLEDHRDTQPKSEAKEKDVAQSETRADAPKDDDRQQDAKDRAEDQPRGRFRNNRFGFRRFGRFGIPPDEYRRRWEEQQSKKPVIVEGITGKVKWYSFRKNYGFIQRDDGEKDVFVHQLAIAKSRIRKPHLRTLANGESVQFDVVQGKQGFEAVNVTGPSGKEVEGCRIIFVFDDFDRMPRYSPPQRYYNDRRPMYYDNYRRPGPGYMRERSYDGRDVGRYPSYRRYPANRAGYRDDKFDRPPYRRERVFQGRRRSYRPADQPKEENAETKVLPTNANDKADSKTTNKGQFRRQRRQYRRRNPKQQKDEDAAKDPEKSVKEHSENKELSTDGLHAERKEKSDTTEDIIKGIGDIVIGEVVVEN